MVFPSLPNLIKNPSEINPLPKLGLLGSLRIDVLKAEELNVEYDISDRPVESGFDVSDARVRRPIWIRVEGILTDTQLTPTAIAGRFVDNDGFELETWDEKKSALVQIADADELISITLPLGFYPNMQIRSLKVEQNTDRTGAAFFTLIARELRIVSSEITSVDPSQIPKELKDKETADQKKASKKGKKKKNKGTKPGKEVPKAKEDSWALQAKGFLGGLFGG
jgi:hypothetical protein